MEINALVKVIASMGFHVSRTSPSLGSKHVSDHMICLSHCFEISSNLELHPFEEMWKYWRLKQFVTFCRFNTHLSFKPPTEQPHFNGYQVQIHFVIYGL